MADKNIKKLAKRKSLFQWIGSLANVQPEAKDLLGDGRIKKIQMTPATSGGTAGEGVGSAYHNTVYSTYLAKLTKKERIIEYTKMAYDPEINYALTEICDELCMENHEGKMFSLKFSSEMEEEKKAILQEEFKELIVNRLGLHEYNTIWNWVYKWLVQGILFFKLDVNSDLATGIEGLEEIEPWNVYKTKDPESGKEFYAIKDFDDAPEGYKHDGVEVLKVDSGYYFDGEYFSILEFAKKDWRRLNLLEDASMIYKISRSPLRRIFKIYVGKMSPQDVELYLNDFKSRMKEDIHYDADKGELVGINPITILDDYYFPVLEGGQAVTEVETLSERENSWEAQDDIRYFLGKMYRSLKIPIGRMNIPDANGEVSTVSTGSRAGEITRDEIKFSKFVRRLQNKFVEDFLQTLFYKHLFFRKMIGKDRLNITKKDLKVKFIYTNPYSELKDQELIDTRIQNFTSLMGSSEGMSWKFLTKKYLKWTDEDMADNEKLLKEEIKSLMPGADEGGMGGDFGGAAPMGGDFGGAAPDVGLTDTPPVDLGAEAPMGVEGGLTDTPPIAPPV